jgi:hypothetical protein
MLFNPLGECQHSTKPATGLGYSYAVKYTDEIVKHGAYTIYVPPELLLSLDKGKHVNIPFIIIKGYYLKNTIKEGRKADFVSFIIFILLLKN